MTQPTHTHQEHGGRWVAVDKHHGTGSLEGQEVVILKDIDKDITSVTTYQDWHDNWLPIAPDTCPVCVGQGTDAIKGNKRQPCGGCYGLGKVKQDGAKPKDEWQVAEVAGKIIEGLRGKLDRAQSAIDAMQRTPGVPEAIDAERTRRKQQAGPPDWVQREQEWRADRGQGAGGGRMTGD